MEPTVRRPPLPAGEPIRTRATRFSRSGRRRRPSGEAPPLPRPLTTGIYWLAATGVVLLLWLLALAKQRHQLLHPLVRPDPAGSGSSQLRTLVLTDVMRGGARTRLPVDDRGPVLGGVGRPARLPRFRHLFVFFGAAVGVIALGSLLAYRFMRPAPSASRSWATGGRRPPVPPGRVSRNRGRRDLRLMPPGHTAPARQAGERRGWSPPSSIARVYLAVARPPTSSSPRDRGGHPHRGVPDARPRRVVPRHLPARQVAHLDVAGRRGEAIHRALADQLGCSRWRSSRSACRARPDPPRCGSAKGDPNTYLFAKLYAAAISAPTAGTSWGGPCCTAGSRTRSRSTPSGASSNKRTTPCGCSTGPGCRSPEPFGIVEITPEREYLITFEFFDDARELGEPEVEVDEAIIDDGLRIIRRLWDAGLAHRDIKPANLLVRQGRVHLIDVFFAEVRPSPWRQAVDLANMMLVLATRSRPQQVYERARLQFNDDEIAEAFAATHGITMPSQLRQWMRDQGRDLHAEFLELLPERPHPISTQRWSVRRVGLLLGVLLVGLLALLIVFSNLRSAGLL